MKAYQVFKGDYDKHGRQYYELDSTYFDRERALQRCKEIIEDDEFKNETVKNDTEFNCEEYMSWYIPGWDTITICKMEQIEIAE
jgi:hypothetical protein